MLSVIIPSYKDPLLKNTILSLLDNATGEVEIIAVLDGYWIKQADCIDDDRVIYLHLGKNQGMRNAINSGTRIARGKYIMRTDEHCMFAKGFDTELTKNCKDNWIVVPRRYYLDPDKWEIMDKKPVDYEKLKVREFANGKKKFEGVVWGERTRERKDIMVDETMAMQGSCWVMTKEWWDTIGELETEGYGPHYQDQHEMIFKTWKRGGKMMVNKNTWYAHKHCRFKRSHNYGSQDGDPHIDYCYNTWIDYYNQVIKPKWKL